MHPAYSVIVFTVSSGIGFGLLVLGAVLAALGRLPAEPLLGLTILGLALAAVTTGLLSSTLHLGHPERAWRAFSQWRTSWLSREGIASVATYFPALAFAFGWIVLGRTGGAWAWVGVAAAALALVTLWCTGMIYASLRAIPAWADPLVAPGYILLGLATGSLWLAAITRVFGILEPAVVYMPAATLPAAWALKAIYWRRLDSGRAAGTAGTATGLGSRGARVRMLEAPHTQENFVMREMGYRIARRHARHLRKLAQGLAFIAPIALIAAPIFAPGGGGPLWAALAVLAAFSGTAGVFIERWLFFAEARHVVTLYYGAESV